jgi:hypothetical protein
VQSRREVALLDVRVRLDFLEDQLARVGAGPRAQRSGHVPFVGRLRDRLDVR